MLRDTTVIKTLIKRNLISRGEVTLDCKLIKIILLFASLKT